MQKLFKAGQHQQAVSKYTMAASVAVQRPPWEASQFMREDVSAILSNRCELTQSLVLLCVLILFFT